jgi:hypothetical protein
MSDLGASDIGDFSIGYSPIGDTGRTGWAIVAASYAALLRQTNGSYPTVALGNVFLPRDWPVPETDQPILKISPPTENKESLGKGGIQFLTSVSFELIAEVSAPALENNASAGKVLTALALFQREIELAIIGDPVLFGGDSPGLVEQLRSVQTKTATTSAGELQRGALSMVFDFTFYQGTEDFQLPVTVDIDRFHLYVDLINVADPLGTYVPPLPYTPTPAPRTDGPDGRIEGEFEVSTS